MVGENKHGKLDEEQGGAGDGVGAKQQESSSCSYTYLASCLPSRERISEIAARPKRNIMWAGGWLISAIGNNKNLAIAVALNFIRDPTWTRLTIAGDNVGFQRTVDDGWDVDSQWFGQHIISTAAMGIGCIGIWCAYKYKKEKVPIKESLIYLAAASAAIFTWDLAQVVGVQIGTYYFNLTAVQAGFFAGLFTGAFEGPTQWAVITIGEYLTDPVKRAAFKADPLGSLKSLLGEAVYSVTVGAVPGDVWQWVFAACTLYEIDPAITSSLVGVSVASCNIAVAKLQEPITNKVAAGIYKVMPCCTPVEKQSLGRLEDPLVENYGKPDTAFGPGIRLNGS